MNDVKTIRPYDYYGMLVFDDPSVGLDKEPQRTCLRRMWGLLRCAGAGRVWVERSARAGDGDDDARCGQHYGLMI